MRRRIAITGATGMLGRDIVAELVRLHLDAPEEIEVLLLGRGADARTLRQRVDDLAEDCAEYARVRTERRDDVRRFLRERVECVELELDREDLGVAPDALERLRRGGIDHLIHLAARTDFRATPEVSASLVRVNVTGTERVLALASALGVRQLGYVGSAYSAGLVDGRVAPDHENRDRSFRNPYEWTKACAERQVRLHARAHGLRVRCFRPSTICGRLLEPPDGAIGAFKVIYGWGAYFLRLKARTLRVTPDRAYDAPLQLPLRLFMNPAGGLNLVPVDFAAKAIVAACLDEAPGESFHVVNDVETPHALYGGEMLRLLNVDGTTFVSSVPTDPSAAERAYYRSAGKLLTPYAILGPTEFVTDTILPVLRRSGLRCPPVDRAALARLLAFAKRHHFGLAGDTRAPATREDPEGPT
jgi:nucleoside-diphosphate-sugar epimerase